MAHYQTAAYGYGISTALKEQTAVKSLIKRLLKSMAFRVARYPRIKYFLLKAINRFPRIKARLHRIVLGGLLPYSRRVMNIPTELAHLTPRARQIYADLKTAVENNKRSN